jgi:Mn-dependent DtxR family transcriptional regulator
MPEENIEGILEGDPNNKWPSGDENFDKENPMAMLPKRLDVIPFFRNKPVKILQDGFSVFFREINGLEYWITEKKLPGSYMVQWLEIEGSKKARFHRKLTNKNGLDVDNNKRDQKLVKYLHEHSGISREEINYFLEDVGVFIGDHRNDILPKKDLENEKESAKTQENEINGLPEKRKNELKKILERPDLLSYIDRAFYERSTSSGFIIGEVESKHVLNFNCIGARLGISTINTLKGESSIGKTNTANVVTGIHRTKKVGSLSDTALKYSEDWNLIDILYIQETLEDEFKNKQARLMSADDGGFIAETTIKNLKTGRFEIQKETIPVKTIVTTTTAIEIDPEFSTRNFIIPVDDSEEQTKRILRENFKTTEKKLQEIRGESLFDYKYEALRQAFQLLKPYTVLIPYEKELYEIFPTKNPRARRDSKKLMQLIKESALLFQYQRCKGQINGQDILVASWVDLGHAIILGGPILEATLTGFDKRLIDALPIVYEIIEDKGYVTSNELQIELGKSSKYAWQILKFFADNNYIYHDHATKIKNSVKGRTKVFIKSGSKEYKSLLLAIRTIKWPRIKEKEEEFIKKQILNSSYNVGDVIHLPHYESRVVNKVVYTPTPINSKEFRIYITKEHMPFKNSNKNKENLMGKSRYSKNSKCIKTIPGVEIDYKNITILEKSIFTQLADLKDHTRESIVEELKSRYNLDEILLTLKDMSERGWIK